MKQDGNKQSFIFFKIVEDTFNLPLIISVFILLLFFISFLFYLPEITLFLALRSNRNFEQAADFYTERKPEKATFLTTKLADELQPDPRHYLKTGLMLKEAGQIKKATTYLFKATELFFFPYTTASYLLSDYYRQTVSSAYLNYGDIIISKNIKEGLFYLTYGADIYEKTPAVKILDRLIEKTEFASDQNLLIVDFYINVGDIKKSDAVLSKLENSLPLENFYLMKGKSALLKGNSNEANKYFKNEIEAHPDNLSALLELISSEKWSSSVDRIQYSGFAKILNSENILISKEAKITKDIVYLNHHNSSITYKINIEKTKENLHPKEFFVVARGKPAGGIWPVMKIIVNEKQRHLIYINSQCWCAYPVLLELKGGENVVKTSFLNDGRYKWHYNEKEKKGSFRENRNIYFNNIWHKE